MQSKEELTTEVTRLYMRLQDGGLRESDLLSRDEAEFKSIGGYVTTIRQDAGEFQKRFSAFMQPFRPFRMFGEDAVILDIGAHWGYSVVAMRHQGAKAMIFSIEALPENARELAHLKDFEKGRYDFAEVAATESPCELVFYIPAVNGVAVTGLTSTGGTLTEYFSDHLVSLAQTYLPKEGQANRFQIIELRVKGLPLDQIAEEASLTDSIEAIKLDVEGHEASVLRGGRRLIGKRLPMIMNEGANRDPGVVAELTAHGYDHYELRDEKFHLRNAVSQAQDGYWLHPARLDYYRQKGLMD